MMFLIIVKEKQELYLNVSQYEIYCLENNVKEKQELYLNYSFN